MNSLSCMQHDDARKTVSFEVFFLCLIKSTHIFLSQNNKVFLSINFLNRFYSTLGVLCLQHMDKIQNVSVSG